MRVALRELTTLAAASMADRCSSRDAGRTLPPRHRGGAAVGGRRRVLRRRIRRRRARRSSRARRRSSWTRPTCRRRAIRSSTTPPASRRSCARPCSSPASIRTSRPRTSATSSRPYAERAEARQAGRRSRPRSPCRSRCRTASRASRAILGDQGCVTLPIGEDAVTFTPVDVKTRCPTRRRSRGRWATPCRTALAVGTRCGQAQAGGRRGLRSAPSLTAAFVVTWKGRIVAERYGEGITATTPLESWSMGKSLTATLMGVLIKQGVYELEQPAPIPEWQTPGRSAREDPHRRHPAHVERAAHPRAAGSGLRSPAGPIPITSTSTPAASIRSNTRRRARCSGRPTRSAATATPIRCSSTT